MFHRLRRHPFPVSAFFRHSLVLTYAFPQELLEPLLSPGLLLDTFEGFGFLAIALVQTESLRPSFLPAAMGLDFFLSGYRLFTRLAGKTASIRGLQILRSDTNRGLMVSGGNALTHYHYHLCKAELQEQANRMHWSIQTPNGEADLEVSAMLDHEPTSPPIQSPFPTLREARRFAGPLPYTFDFEAETGSIIGVRALRQRWEPKPVHVCVEHAAFLKREPFCRAEPVLANAFHVRDVPYHWQRGRQMR